MKELGLVLEIHEGEIDHLSMEVVTQRLCLILICSCDG